MAQALLDLTYYKCGHCMQNFNSVAAFAKHQKEVHTPKNAPKVKRKTEKEEEKQEANQQEEPKTIIPEPANKKAHFDFVLKLKLCQNCASLVTIDNYDKVQIPLCKGCLSRNGFF